MDEDGKKKLVMMFGTFDFLHAGHENIFQQARELGDEIIVVIAKDKTVQKIKGELPDKNEKERVKTLSETQWVDKVVLGNLKEKTKHIKLYKPNIIALGHDQFAFTYGLEKLLIDEKLNTEIVRLKPYKTQIYKSSILKENK